MDTLYCISFSTEFNASPLMAHIIADQPPLSLRSKFAPCFFNSYIIIGLSFIAAQIVAGVGFLGAGSILRDGNKISGLTTAAGIWLVAAVGMAVGYGQYFIGAIATASVLILQLFVRKMMNTFDYVQLYDSLTIKSLLSLFVR